MVRIALVWIAFAVATGVQAQLCDSSTITQKTIRASQTDPKIAWELSGSQVLFHSSCPTRGKLLLYLVGSFDGTNQTFKFGTLAAQMGYHVIILKYENSVAAQSACANSSNSSCYEDFRKEIIYGVESSTAVDVDSIHSVVNRVNRLLEYLNQNFANEQWDQFLVGQEVDWTKVTVAGHSQGGGHAAYIAQEELVDRAIFFAGPNDYSSYFSGPASWLSKSFQTPGTSLFGFNNLQDDVVDFADQMQVWQSIPFSKKDTVIIDGKLNPFGFGQALYTNYHANGSGSENHSAVVRDPETPLDGNGKPVYLEVWKYLLGELNTTSKRAINQTSDARIFTTGATLNFDPNGTSVDELQVISPSGQIVFQQAEVSDQLSLSNFSKGVYMILWKEAGITHARKLIH